eukprot:gene23655-gene15335
MSRIGKKVIKIPNDVSVQVISQKISIKGNFGELEKNFLPLIEIKKEGQELFVFPLLDTKQAKAYHGLVRVLIQNMINGVTKKFSKILNAEGVGYKFQLDKDKLILNVGFTHPVKFIIPENLNVKLESPTKIVIAGIDKEQVGFFASKIRNTKPPEPYKGKGILYEGEKILRKAGKTGK